MKNVFVLMVICSMTACMPDSIKEKMNDGMTQAQTVMADWQFKNALAHIELHKLRNGSYPNSLQELQFLSSMDSSMFANVEYTRLDSVYELNVKTEFPSFDGKETRINLRYAADFWKGLGCVKSNVK
jgi:hypothetical protein